MSPFPKVCKICHAQHYRGDWSALPFLGYQELAGVRLELHDCRCTNTLAIEVEPTGLPFTLAGDLAEVFRNEARDVEGLPPPYSWPPLPHHPVSDAEMAEANRLYDIADVLGGRVSAWTYRDDPEAA